MSLPRRDLLQLFAASPLPGLLGVTPATLERAVRVSHDARTGQDAARRFFTSQEWPTVRLLSDLILPRDERSGSATDAGVPEFIDVLLAEGSESHQVAVRGGLVWLDRECRARYGHPFRETSESERTEMLDAIAWPARSSPSVRPGVAFFTRFRDLVAGGFWSSEMGVEDLGYVGNRFVTAWTGCPDAVIRSLGL